jgi:hypothetical protein
MKPLAPVMQILTFESSKMPANPYHSELSVAAARVEDHAVLCQGRWILQHRWEFVLGVVATMAVLAIGPAYAVAADPVIYATGDIACAPGSSQTATTCHEKQT